MDTNKYFSNRCETVDDCASVDKHRRDWKKPRLLEPFLVIWEDILQFMAGLAARAGEMEIGGELYGLLTHAGRLVVMLATPPGKDAISEKACFCQDIQFMKDTNAYLGNEYGVQYVGNWHNHHLMSNCPSGGDVRSTHMIAQKNQYEKMCQIILTFGNDPDEVFTEKPYDSPINWMRSKNADILSRNALPRNLKATKNVRVNAFVYPDARHSHPVRCPLKILPGNSPFDQTPLRKPGLSQHTPWPRHPLSKIIYDQIATPSERVVNSRELPSSIKEQCLLLPEKLQQKLEIVFKENMILLSLKLIPKKGEIIVAYQKKPEYEATAVYLILENSTKSRSVDITSETLVYGSYTRLSTIYENVMRLQGAKIISENEKDSEKSPYRYQSIFRRKPERRSTHDFRDFPKRKDNTLSRRSSYALRNKSTDPGRKGNPRKNALSIQTPQDRK